YLNPIARHAIDAAGVSIEQIVSIQMPGDGAAVLFADDLEPAHDLLADAVDLAPVEGRGAPAAPRSMIRMASASSRQQSGPARRAALSPGRAGPALHLLLNDDARNPALPWGIVAQDSR